MVEQDEVKLVVTEHDQRVGPGPAQRHAMAGPLQAGADDVGDVVVILDHEEIERFRHGCSRSGSRKPRSGPAAPRSAPGSRPGRRALRGPGSAPADFPGPSGRTM